MTVFTPYSALAGGILIGIVAALLLLGLGRVLGISGFLHGLISKESPSAWRFSFLMGLLISGAIAAFFVDVPDRATDMPMWQILIAGLLVGYGTRMGSGCTSGHGVCGLGRRSLRSVVAVLVFMASAVAVVAIMRHLIGV